MNDQIGPEPKTAVERGGFSPVTPDNNGNHTFKPPTLIAHLVVKRLREISFMHPDVIRCVKQTLERQRARLNELKSTKMVQTSKLYGITSGCYLRIGFPSPLPIGSSRT